MMDASREGLVTVTDEDIKRLHGIYLEFLKDLDDFLTANGLSYALGGGSMLGAVRHKGFIPWDDDLDITMTREDFDKFAGIADTFMPGKYYLKKPGDEGYLFHWPKLFIKGIVFDELLSAPDSPRELFVDIFIVEDAPDKKFQRKIRGYKSSLYLLACSSTRVRRCRSKLASHITHSPEVQKEIRRRSAIGFFFGFKSLEKWCIGADKYFSSYKNPSSADVVIPSGALHFWGEIYPREVLTLTRRVPFENITVSIPLYAEKYLEKRYGPSYMNVPPEGKRAKHSLLELSFGEGEDGL